MAQDPNEEGKTHAEEIAERFYEWLSEQTRRLPATTYYQVLEAIEDHCRASIEALDEETRASGVEDN